MKTTKGTRKTRVRFAAVGIALAATALVAATTVDRARTTADEDAVHAAVLDYVEGVYDVAPERIERSVHPSLRKVGWFRTRDGWGEAPMTYEQLVALAGEYNRDGHVAADAPKRIELLDVLDKTASAKLTAEWGIDYFHLAKLDGRWMIMNVVWQSHPE